MTKPSNGYGRNSKGNGLQEKGTPVAPSGREAIQTNSDAASFDSERNCALDVASI